MNKEFQYLVEIFKWYIYNNQENIVRPEYMDPNHFIRYIVKNRAMRLIENFFNKTNLEIPDELNNQINKKRTIIIQKQFEHTSELVRISEIFNRNSIDFVILKGTVLGKLIYNDFSYRDSLDCDILIRESDVEETVKLLQDNYYEILTKEYFEGNLGWKLFKDLYKHCVLKNKQNNIIVELHWDLTKRYIQKKGLNSYLKNSRKIMLNQYLFPVLSNEDNFEYLCMHGIIHRYSRITWLLEIALFTQKMNIDWKEVFKMSYIHDTFRYIKLTLVLIKEIFGLDMNTPFEDKLNRRERLLLAECKRNMTTIAIPDTSLFWNRIRQGFYFFRLDSFIILRTGLYRWLFKFMIYYLVKLRITFKSKLIFV
ncbi:nucleotidyltransferase family protein [Bacteroidota bacterium]